MTLGSLCATCSYRPNIPGGPRLTCGPKRAGGPGATHWPRGPLGSLRPIIALCALDTRRPTGPREASTPCRAVNSLRPNEALRAWQSGWTLRAWLAGKARESIGSCGSNWSGRA